MIFNVEEKRHKVKAKHIEGEEYEIFKQV